MQFIVALSSLLLLPIFVKAQTFEFATFADSNCENYQNTYECTSPTCDGEFYTLTHSIEILATYSCNLYLWSGDFAGEEGYLPSYDVTVGECIHFTAGYPIESFEAVCA